MATIMCLPVEVVAIIVSYNDIEDFINFRCVCKKFRLAAKYDKHWEKKVSQRWPSAKELYDKQSKKNEQMESEENEQMDERSLNFMETGVNCARQLRSYVSQIIHQHYYDNESIDNYDNKSIDNLIKLEDVFHLDENLRNNFDEIISKPKNILKYSFFIDEIKNLLIQSPRRTGCDLTERYCNIKIFHYMGLCSIKLKCEIFKEVSLSKQLLEATATIVAQYIQPQKYVSYSWVEASLDNIAQGVLNCLREKHPDHSIFSTSAEAFTYWKNNNIFDSHWNEAEGMQIIDTLQEYVFGTLNFRPSKSEDTNLEYMCIDNVLKTKYGRDIILYIIYHSVARRLGLRCNVIDLQYRSSAIPIYCIFWKPNRTIEYTSENVKCFNISFEKFPDCLVNQISLFRTLYSRRFYGDVFSITADLMWREMRELLSDFINQYDNSFRINTRESIYYIKSRKLMLRFKKTEQLNTRQEDVKFPIGMIVTHPDEPKNHGWLPNPVKNLPPCAGVIIGWHRYENTDVTCSVSDSYNLCPFDFFMQCELPLNHCCNFNLNKEHTYYIILTESNKMCYVGEDAITLTTPKWIDNSEIGRYFSKFEDTHYVPNKMLARLYPQDADITSAITARSEN